MGISMRGLLRLAPPAGRIARCAAFAASPSTLALVIAFSPVLMANAQSLPGGPSDNPFDDIRLDVLNDQLWPADAERRLRSKLQSAGIPPDHGKVGGLGSTCPANVQAGRNRACSSAAAGPDQNRIF